MVSCTLLLQRVLATCTIQRDFDRVVGATLSTLADGDATSRETRVVGEHPAFAPAEEVLLGAGLQGDGVGSAGDRMLSGQAMVRLYLVRMLLEIITLPLAADGSSTAEGVYVGGIGSPCAREALRAAEIPAAAKNGDSSVIRKKTRLERWIGGVPPVCDVYADGVGVPSPLYVARQWLLRSVCLRALRADWFISLLETCREEVRAT